jgi:ATP-dependent DNA helicase RecG
VIEHADRFGLAQLHQLRGRIGRGAHKSHCILIAPQKVTEEARARLETLVATADGFKIAEEDLKLRGPGEFFGTRQHGEVGFQIAHPLRDHKLLDLARGEAFALVEDAERAAELEGLKRFLGNEWQNKFRLASVG